VGAPPQKSIKNPHLETQDNMLKRGTLKKKKKPKGVGGLATAEKTGSATSGEEGGMTTPFPNGVAGISSAILSRGGEGQLLSSKRSARLVVGRKKESSREG